MEFGRIAQENKMAESYLVSVRICPRKGKAERSGKQQKETKRQNKEMLEAKANNGKIHGD